MPALATSLSKTVFLTPASSARNVIQPSAVAVVPLTCKLFTGSSANLQEWQDSTGVVKAKISSAGILTIANNLVIGLNFSIQNPATTSFYYLNTGTASVMANERGLIMSASAAAYTPLTVKGFASQSVSLHEWQDSSANILSRINKDGYVMTRKIAAPADADVATSEMALWLDNTAGATKLMIKAKDSAGTVRTASVALT